MAACDPYANKLCDPTGAGTIDVFIKNLFNAAIVLVALITIGVVVYSGFRMMMSGGNQEQLSKAKSSFLWSLMGFVTISFGFAIVSGIMKFFDARDISPSSGQPENLLLTSDILQFAKTVFDSALSLVGLVALLLIIFNGFRYITAQGNEEQTSQAKQGLQWSIVGLIISILAYVIVTATAKLFNLA